MRQSLRQLGFALGMTTVLLTGVVSSAILSIQTNTNTASAAACGSEPATTTGKVTQTISVPATGTYTIWSRLKAPSASAVEYKAYVNGQCFTVGQTALTPSTLTWVDHENGSTSDKATVTLSAGSHTLILTAGTQDLELDRVMFLNDSCVPTGTGDNCLADTTNPTTSITAPANGATVSGTVNITANASDNDAIDYVEFYRDGSTLLTTDSAAPYSYAWDTTSVADGAHTLTVRAYDLSGNNTTSSTRSVTVDNINPVNADITSFTATPATITVGQSSTLNWAVAAGTGCSINQGIGAVGTSGPRAVSPTTTTTYTLTCNGLNGGSNDTATTTVTVNPAPVNADITSFTASPTTIVNGNSSSLAWAVAAGTGCTINQGIGAVATNGNQSVSPTANTTYTLTCSGTNGGTNDTATTTVTVNPAPVNANITSFTASPTTITEGQSSTLNWSGSAGTGCTINQGVGAVSLNGTRSVSPTATTTYTLTCSGTNGGTNDTATAIVTVNPVPDTDGDGVKDDIEQAGTNGGDANYDGTDDHLQASVVSLINAKTGLRNLLTNDNDCDFIAASSVGSTAAGDQQGRWSFSLDCADSTVRVFLDKIYDTATWKTIKLDSSFATKADITGQVTFASQTLGGASYTTMSYDLVDGGELDEDGLANGVIVDPVAILAAASGTGSGSGDSGGPTLAETGASVTTYMATAFGTVIAGFMMIGYTLRKKLQ